jgi:hypothetical protein
MTGLASINKSKAPWNGIYTVVANRQSRQQEDALMFTYVTYWLVHTSTYATGGCNA